MSFLLWFFVLYFTIFDIVIGTCKPTFQPTFQPTSEPTYDASIIDVRNAISGQLTEFFENEDNIYYCIFIIFGICTSFAIMGVIHRYSKCPVFGKYGDSDDVSVFFLVAVRMADFVTDILFILYIYQYKEALSIDESIFILAILFYSSIGTIIIAFILNIVFTHKIFAYEGWFIKQRVLSYLGKNLNKNIFTLISVFTLDVILALHVTKSKFLGLYMFDSGITSYEIIYKFGYIKLISITIFENIPSLMIQILFTLNYEFTILSVVSIIFSGYSIIMSIMNHCMINASSKSGTPVSYSIKFDVEASEQDFRKLIKPKFGLHSALKTKIRCKIGSRQNDLEIGCIDHDDEQTNNKYNVRIHLLSTIHDNKFKFKKQTIKEILSAFFNIKGKDSIKNLEFGYNEENNEVKETTLVNSMLYTSHSDHRTNKQNDNQSPSLNMAPRHVSSFKNTIHTDTINTSITAEKKSGSNDPNDGYDSVSL